MWKPASVNTTPRRATASGMSLSAVAERLLGRLAPGVRDARSPARAGRRAAACGWRRAGRSSARRRWRPAPAAAPPRRAGACRRAASPARRGRRCCRARWVPRRPRRRRRRTRSASATATSRGSRSTSPVCSVARIPTRPAACRPAISGCCSGCGHRVAHVADAELAQQPDELGAPRVGRVGVVEVRDDADRVEEALRGQVAGGAAPGGAPATSRSRRQERDDEREHDQRRQAASAPRGPAGALLSRTSRRRSRASAPGTPSREKRCACARMSCGVEARQVLAQRARQRPGVAGRDEQAGAAGDDGLAQAAGVDADHRPARGLRLDRGDAELLDVGHDERRRPGVEPARARRRRRGPGTRARPS